jgi:hypothetical protein
MHKGSLSRVWLGIDFSGDYLKWGPGCSRSNVWIASIAETHDGLVVDSVLRVQDLDGDGPPFRRLAAVLGAGGFEGAAIDAPFSLPRVVIPEIGHSGVVGRVALLPCGDSRPFAQGSELIQAFLPAKAPRGEKIYRATEERWLRRGVNVRSTMWAGPRGGAPMTVACMTLLAASGAPLWPWEAVSHSIVAEAFPAAQLAEWRLPHQRYANGQDVAIANRRRILAAIQERARVPMSLHPVLLSNADALDGVLCAFSAIAVTEGQLASEPSADADVEGWIAVHR